ncbi:MAG: hypothetical protein ACD_10C00556G0003 [uncultured bacterium]|nr:MAG: hypothetical protein ACD_10C00556G0003 [uncultured bacterium]
MQLAESMRPVHAQKIFRPVVMKLQFALIGPVHCLTTGTGEMDISRREQCGIVLLLNRHQAL